MGKYKIIALDMDGTLLNHQQQISPGNRAAIRSALDAGLKVVIATGRGIQNVRPFLRELQLELPLITANGAEVWRTPDHLYSRTLMEPEAVRQLHSIAVDFDTWYWGYAVSGLFNKEKWVADEKAEAWLKFGYYMEDAAILERVLEHIRTLAPLEITNSDPHNLEVNSHGVSKASGLQEICNWFDTDMSEVVAMGDSLNDMAMIREAGLGVAMGNAQEAVKKAADTVSLSNEEDGVAKIIHDILAAR